MKKLLLAALFLSFCGSLKAEELRPQFRVWKSSFLGAGTFGSPVQMSSSPIIFHMVYGSGTVSIAGDSYFSVWRATTDNFSGIESTKCFVPLNQGVAELNGINVPYDIFSDSHTYFTKQGGAVVGYEYDFFRYVPWDPFTKD